MFQRLIRLGLAPALTIAAIAAAAPARAQFTQSGNAYYTTADYTLSTDVSSNEVFVGKDPGTFATLGGTVTLTVETGANVSGFGATYPDGNVYSGLNVFGNHRASITGGYVGEAYGYDNSTTNISGGIVTIAYAYANADLNISGGNIVVAGSFNSSTMDISGGNIGYTYVLDNSATNISGGSFEYAYGFINGITNISGGTLTNGFFLYDNSTVNFFGTGLSFAYQSYGNSNPYALYADYFQVSGTIGGEARTYDLYIYNGAGSGGTSNPTQRQFNLVTVPEPSALALALPAFGMIGAVVLRRRKK